MNKQVLALALCFLLIASPLTHGKKRKKRGSKVEVEERVFRGLTAPIDRFPYMCSLRQRGDRGHKCGGVLIRPEWLLTAAHCVDENYENSVGLSPIVYCGIYSVNDHDDDSTFKTVEAYVHPSWKSDVMKGYDVAVLKLDREANLTSPDIDTSGNVVSVGSFLSATGWGTTESEDIAQTLQLAEQLLYVRPSNCEEYHDKAVLKHTICAGIYSQDTCRGDSGGPLFLADSPDGNITAGRPDHDLLVGITSFGSEACDASVPGVYTSVSSLWKWISGVVDGKKEKNRTKKRSKESKSEKKKKPSGTELEDATSESSSTKKSKEKETGKEKSRSPPTPPSKPQRKKGARSSDDPFNELENLSERQLLTEMLDALDKDDSIRAEAILLEGLAVDTEHESSPRQVPRLVKGSTLLHWAAFHDAVECIDVLEDYGAEIDQANDDLLTPLHIAAHKGREAACKALIGYGANVEAKDEDETRPLHFAAQGSLKVVKVLLDEEASVSARDIRGWAPLHFASSYGQLEIAQALVDDGASSTLTDFQGETAFDVVCQDESCPVSTRIALFDVLG